MLNQNDCHSASIKAHSKSPVKLGAPSNTLNIGNEEDEKSQVEQRFFHKMVAQPCRCRAMLSSSDDRIQFKVEQSVSKAALSASISQKFL